MSSTTRYRLGGDGASVMDGDRRIAVVTGELSDGAKIVRALNERDGHEHADLFVPEPSDTPGWAQRQAEQANPYERPTS